MKFAQSAATVAGTESAKPSMFDFGKNDIMRGVELLAMLIVAVGVIFFVLRPPIAGLLGGGAAAQGGGPLLAGPGGAGAPALAGAAGGGSLAPPVAGALPAPRRRRGHRPATRYRAHPGAGELLVGEARGRSHRHPS